MPARDGRRIQRVAWIEPGRLPYGYEDYDVYSEVVFPRAGPKMAALLRAQGWETEVLCGALGPLDPDDIAERFDAACISVLSNTTPHGLLLGRWLTERGLPVLLGGYQFAHQQTTAHTLYPTRQALDFAPYVVRGEGFEAVPQWLRFLDGQAELGSVPGISYRDQHGRIIHQDKAPLLSSEAIAALPPADWSAVAHLNEMRCCSVHGMYGCPRACSWCAVWPRDGRISRLASPTAFVDELEAALQAGPFRHVFFSADNFPAFHGWAEQVCEEIIRRGLSTPWTCQAEVAATRHSRLLELAAMAGCQRWCLGLESIDSANLADSNKRQSESTMEIAIRELHRHGIAIHGMFIVGLPHDTPETVKRTVAWARKMRLETCQFLCLADLPGSVDYESGRTAPLKLHPFAGIYEPLNWLFDNGHYARLRNASMSHAEVQAEMMAAMHSFYSLRRTLGAFLLPHTGSVGHARRHGAGWLAALKAGYWHSFIAGCLRWRGYANMKRWLRGPLNQAFLRMLHHPEQAEAAREAILAFLPPRWLTTLAAVHAERNAAAVGVPSESWGP